MYILIVFLTFNSEIHGISSVEFNSKAACENAKAEMHKLYWEYYTGEMTRDEIPDMLCVPKGKP